MRGCAVPGSDPPPQTCHPGHAITAIITLQSEHPRFFPKPAALPHAAVPGACSERVNPPQNSDLGAHLAPPAQCPPSETAGGAQTPPALRQQQGRGKPYRVLLADVLLGGERGREERLNELRRRRNQLISGSGPSVTWQAPSCGEGHEGHRAPPTPSADCGSPPGHGASPPAPLCGKGAPNGVSWASPESG